MASTSFQFSICLTANGEKRQVVNVNSESCVSSLFDLASEIYGRKCEDLKCGFPPKSMDPSIPIHSILNKNDRVTVILETPIDDENLNTSKKMKQIITKNNTLEENPQLHQSRKSQRVAARAATESFSEVIRAQDKILKDQMKVNKRKRQNTKEKDSILSSTSQKKSSLSSSSRNFAKLSSGRRLVDGEVELRPDSSMRRSGPKWKSTEDVSVALLNALESGGGGKVGRVLRGAMKSAVSQQYDLNRAVARVSAVLAGSYRIDVDPTSKCLMVRFDKGLEGRGQLEENVDAIPREALELVLKGIHASDQESLRATTLAQLSPRVFWSLLHETSQKRSTDDALQELLPDLDWSFLKRRKLTLSEKAIENLRQANQSSDQSEADLEAAAEAIQAVENAMDNLHQYDQMQRRSRSATAALARLGHQPESKKRFHAWKLVTPSEVDEDELRDCTGGNSEYASSLLLLGFCNWRQLANAKSNDVAGKLELNEELVESWIDLAQGESIKEIIVEICDNRLDVVEILIDQANSGTPKDLANWRHMPDMLLETASELKMLQVTLDDVTTWCERAHNVVEENSWISWYATPVD
jgi:predicted flap endonuclease-1-like 5' DNA nuclease